MTSETKKFWDQEYERSIKDARELLYLTRSVKLQKMAFQNLKLSLERAQTKLGEYQRVKKINRLIKCYQYVS